MLALDWHGRSEKFLPDSEKSFESDILSRNRNVFQFLQSNYIRETLVQYTSSRQMNLPQLITACVQDSAQDVIADGSAS